MYGIRTNNSRLTAGPVCSLQIYPERDRSELNSETLAYKWWADRIPVIFKKKLNTVGLLDKVNENAESLTKLPKSAIIKQLLALRKPLCTEGTRIELTATTFALIRELSGRCLGLRHYDCQILAAWAMLNGKIAEMETGEGKTLAISLAAATAALAGTPVHVLTANDYLAERDAKNLLPLYRSMGLRIGVVTAMMGAHERRHAYACDITYCTARELAFDYLRDRQVFGSETSDITRHIDRLYGAQSRSSRLLLRGLHMAILDECDSILIDEASTPLVLSGPSPDKPTETAEYVNALKVASTLIPKKHFFKIPKAGHFELTQLGIEKIKRQTTNNQSSHSAIKKNTTNVVIALSALYLFHQEQHYLVRDNRVQIIDENTGRVKSHHSWDRGLQHMIETKEGCPLSNEQTVLSRISYQRLFRRYLRCAGTTGTASQVAGELRSVYKLSVMPIPTHKPVRRHFYNEKVFATESEKLDAVVQRVRQFHETGRPVLLATPTVAASETYSRRLSQEGLVHQLLSARQDSREAEVVSKAGALGSITIATNMAGRGTDIAIDEIVIERGGLHVIASERHAARRIDIQLFGRCARQGDPGSCDVFTSIEDPMVKSCYPPWLIRLMQRCLRQSIPLTTTMAPLISKYAQWRMECTQAQNRRDLLRSEVTLEQTMGFTGPPE